MKNAMYSWLPNWRDPAVYPQPDSENRLENWYWQFVRRDPRYQNDFASLPDRPADVTLPAGIWSPSEELKPATPAMREHWGMNWLPDFRHESINQMAMIRGEILPRWGARFGQFVGDKAQLGWNAEGFDVVLVDLKLPIAEQLAWLQPHLERQQSKRKDILGVTGLAGRRRFAEWVVYLRALDGLASGIDYGTVGAELFMVLDEFRDNRAAARKRDRKHQSPRQYAALAKTWEKAAIQAEEQLRQAMTEANKGTVMDTLVINLVGRKKPKK